MAASAARQVQHGGAEVAADLGLVVDAVPRAVELHECFVDEILGHCRFRSDEAGEPQQVPIVVFVGRQELVVALGSLVFA